MKISLTLAVLILAAAALFGWKDHQTLSKTRENHEALIQEARALGLDPAALASQNKASPLTRLTRDSGGDKEAEAKTFAAELIAFAKEMEEFGKTGKEPDEEMQKRTLSMIERMGRLDISQMKTLVAELRADTTIDDKMRRDMTGFAVMSLSENHPQAALALFTESSHLFDKNGRSQHIVASALSQWAQDDPMGALDWIEANAEKHPDTISDHAKRSVLTGTARQDPRLAFQLLDDLGFAGGMVGNSIANGATNPAERTAVLSALRDHLKTVTNPETRERLLSSTMGTMCQQAISDGFDAAASWLDSASFNAEETEAFANGLNFWERRDDTGKWIEWLGGELPQDKLEQKVGHLMRDWTNNDYEAAGQWLQDADEGPSKQAAVASYAKTVAPYEPDVAAQWAVTLPAGEQRDALVKTVYEEWKMKDEAAAAEFAKRQGIGE